MDSHNLFETPATYRALRAEYLVGLGVATTLFFIHLGDIRVLPAIGLFYYNDAIGYLPGAVAYRRAKGRRISNTYYTMYNVTHSIVTSALVMGAWALIVGPEWAMITQAIHVCTDRAVFGNFMKPFSVAFEPKEHPVYARVKDLLAKPMDEAEASRILIAEQPMPPVPVAPRAKHPA